jgi:hypothetical protein
VRWVLLDAWRRVNGRCYKDACQASGSAASVIHPFYLSPIRLSYKSAFPLSQSFSHLSLFPSTYFDHFDALLYLDSKLFAFGIYLHLLSEPRSSALPALQTPPFVSYSSSEYHQWDVEATTKQTHHHTSSTWGAEATIKHIFTPRYISRSTSKST